MNARPARPRRAARLSAVLALLAASCSPIATTAPRHDEPTPITAEGVERRRVEVVAEHPHDPEAFTQGLELHGPLLYESSGGQGSSWVRVLDVRRDEVLVQRPVEGDLFAEGLTRVGDELVVLTWLDEVALVLDAATLEERRRLRYEGEGWGLCHDGERLVMSDGSDVLTLRDPDDFSILGTVAVRAGGEPVADLNELECVGDVVLANVWRQDVIVEIDPATGEVTAVIDAAGLAPPGAGDDPEAVLNGIAHDAGRDTFVLTGKRWGVRYEVRFVAGAPQAQEE